VINGMKGRSILPVGAQMSWGRSARSPMPRTRHA
jgi:hypothetical protein